MKHRISHILVWVVLFFVSMLARGQNTQFDQLIQQGIIYHDKGNYDSAILIYQQALAISPESPLANYEIAYSYYSKGDIKQATRHCKQAMVEGDNSYLPAAIIYGSILDETNQTKKSIKLYKKVLKTYPDNYLLHYNMAISYGNANNLEKAEYHAVQAIYNNPSHGSSHLALAKIKYQEQELVRSILPLYFFLLLEPNTDRSVEAINLLFEQLNQGVSKDGPKNISITINENDIKKNKGSFGNMETLIKMMAATQYLADSLVGSEFEWFSNTSKTIFTTLEKKDKPANGESVWYDLYIPILAKLSDSKHYEAYCYYITQKRYDESLAWLDDHVLEVDLMFESINQ